MVSSVFDAANFTGFHVNRIALWYRRLALSGKQKKALALHAHPMSLAALRSPYAHVLQGALICTTPARVW
jgi:hypothetical protein